MYKSLLQNFKAFIKVVLTLIESIFDKSGTLPKVCRDDTTSKFSGGGIEFVKNNNGKSACDGCGSCQKVCPCTDAIQIKTLSDSAKVTSFVYQIDKSICIMCGQCIEYCPQQALQFSEESVNCTENKKELIMELTKD